MRNPIFFKPYSMRLQTIFLASLVLASSCNKKDVESKQEKHEDQVCAVGSTRASGDIIPGQYIVALQSHAVARSSSAQQIENAGEAILSRNGINETALEETYSGGSTGFVATLSAQQVAELQTDPAVQAIEPDRIIALSHCFQVAEPRTITWNIEKVGYGDGRGKTAWVVDTGIDFEHQDLNVDKPRSRSFIEGNTNADDENGHGTHVAGVIGALNNNFGVLGVASGANLVSLKVLDKDGVGRLSYVLQALAYINQSAKKGDVVNLSLGEDQVSEILDQQIKYTASLGIYLSIAAGNDAKPAIQFSPGRANGTNIYTISAVDSLNTFATFSNFGNDVIDFAAPGVRILSTFTDGRYARMSGTSMAAPHVAGLLLLKGANISSSGSALNDPDGTPDLIARK
jgi:subtilisin